ncbi:MAG: hypothetical protein A2887_06930 [Alphaproteobacteria bacterium RIFCSPLOWO2_01_FULL_40_26]|nr:MAG: hypothetical protein A2794_00600 [Alphaproteobacteria bacterium RIFCSPHIGHO2_01_FULL_40_8]OFW95567.1 MAG: hypothetical protein A2887_06930 [Alphaproteobacteria bacterium RIFCSPLOWO2_01_FULL_40_26]OFX10602.1 MAG: hypothetical protein A3H30_01670 [Alphaproteobacteria bacterium RIFCSPLOWO2_02_FULL_40_19]OFX12303.1 MAG: hypothetical protein A3G22_06395 [Alphaproteobacteria bacterium RIFCSPLOWO2_12_FULL_40_11]
MIVLKILCLFRAPCSVLRASWIQITEARSTKHEALNIPNTEFRLTTFFITNQFFRRIKNFTHQILTPLFTKFVLLFITFLILAFIVLKIFKPEFLTKIYTKSSFYFFHYLNLDNHEFAEINISGNKHVNKEQIIDIINSAKEKLLQKQNIEYQPLVQNLIDEIKTNLPWVNKVVISRSMPRVLNIFITEYEPFAIWQYDGKKYIIDKDGNAIPFEESSEFDHMVILSGKAANINAKSLFNIFTADPKLSQNVYSATWVGNRRWDIRFSNGLLIKLPEASIAQAWEQLIKINHTQGSIIGLKMIDLRIKDKIYLEYEDSVMKEIREL